MKKLLLSMCMCLLVFSLWAQGRQVAGVVYNQEDGQPMIGAEVTVDGTSLSTVTDLDGRFVFDNVPADARSVYISSIGMASMRARIPQEEGEEILVNMQRVEKKVTPFVRAGVVVSATNDGDTGIGFRAGAGAHFYLTRYFSLSPSLQVVRRAAKYDGGLEIRPLYLQLPLLVESKIWLKRRGYGNRLVFNYGPYVAYGIGGKAKLEGIEADLFSKTDGQRLLKRFDAGLHLGCGVQLKSFYAGVNMELSVLDAKDALAIEGDSDGMSFVVLDFSLGYSF